MKLITKIVVACFYGCLIGSHAAEFHVAPSGDDANTGSAQKPFATLQKARDAVRSARAQGENVSVILHGGIYRLGKTLEFDVSDSGTVQSPVIWKAAPGENVRIVGGVVVPPNAIKPVTDSKILNRVVSAEVRQHLLQIDLPALGVKDFGQVGPRGFRRPYVPAPLELFVSDKPMLLARWPNPGQPASPIGKVLDTGSIPRNGDRPTRGGKFLVKTDRPKLWSNVNDIWISGLFFYGYADDTVCLAGITETTNGLVFRTVQPHLYGFKSGSPWNTWYALNVLEEIDLPSEYAVDRGAGKLYFLPPAGFDLSKSEVMVSTLAEPLLALDGASHIRFENVTFEVSRGMGVYIERGEACVLSSCVFRNLGMLGVCVGQGIAPDPLYQHGFTGQPMSRQLGSWHEHIYENPTFNRQAGSNHRIENCSFYDLGAGGISLGGGDRKLLLPANNTVFNSEFHDFNRWDRAYRSAVNIDGVGNRIQHCLIYNAPGSAIYLHGNDHLIENNEVHHVMMDGDDMGAFYMGRDPSERGNVIRSNYWHDLAPERFAFCLYFDDAGGDGSKVYGNIFCRAGNVSTVYINNSSDITVANNIFINCNSVLRMGPPAAWRTKEGRFEKFLKTLNYNQPPWSEHYPDFVDYLDSRAQMPRRDVFTNNLVVNCKRATAQHMESKNNWITTDDPGFVDMAKGDYRLKTDAQAFKQIPGFAPGDLSQMGLIK